MKKVIKLAFVAAFVAVAGYGVYTNQTSDAISDLVLANVDALASSNEADTGYETVRKDEIEVVDSATGIRKKMITFVCEGVGASPCA